MSKRAERGGRTWVNEYGWDGAGTGVRVARCRREMEGAGLRLCWLRMRRERKGVCVWCSDAERLLRRRSARGLMRSSA